MTQKELSIAIKLADVSLKFFPNTPNEITALDRLSLDIYVGEWMYVLGGNGCGKSTLLRTVSGLYKPSSGNVIYSGIGRSAISLVESVSYNELVPSMTVYENLMLVNSDRQGKPRFRNYHSLVQKELFAETLKTFGLGLEERLRDQVVGLSSGQQQAIVAAKVLLSSAKILLLDEFTSALDKKTAPVILRILRDHCRACGVTVIAVTHDYNSINDTADRLILMESGKVVEVLNRRSNNASALYAPQDDMIKQTIVSEFTVDVVMERLYGTR